MLAFTDCRVSEVLQPPPRRVDLRGRALVFESIEKRRRSVDQAVPVPPALLWTSSTWCTASPRPAGAATGIPDRPPWD